MPASPRNSIGVRVHVTRSGTPGPQAHSIGFLLLPAFPIYALVLATESLRVANQHSGRVAHMSGAAVAGSLTSGMGVPLT